MDITLVSKAGGFNYSEMPSITITKNTQEIKSEINKCEEKVPEEDVKKVVEKLNKLLDEGYTHAEYSVNEGFGDIVIKIVDDETRQVVNEFPSEKVLNMVKKLCDLAGILIDKKA